MMLSITFSPLVHASLDMPIFHASQNQVSLSFEAEEHGHSHEIDDDAQPNNMFGYSHDHTSTDHSHDVPGVAGYRGQNSWPLDDRCHSHAVIAHIDHPLFTIERPPRL